jgi:hypothetical protein
MKDCPGNTYLKDNDAQKQTPSLENKPVISNDETKSAPKKVWYAVQSYWAEESAYHSMEVMEWFESKEEAKTYARQMAKQNAEQDDIGFRLAEYTFSKAADPGNIKTLMKNTIEDHPPLCDLESEEPAIQDWQFYKAHSLQNGTSIAEAGSLKIGNDFLTLLIPNNMGDGETDWYEIEDDYLPMEAVFFTSIEGEFSNYESEESSQAAASLSGFYSIYIHWMETSFL